MDGWWEGLSKLITLETRAVCPYCGNSSFHNSWGLENARCCRCGREFDMVIDKGCVYGKPIKEAGK